MYELKRTTCKNCTEQITYCPTCECWVHNYKTEHTYLCNLPTPVAEPDGRYLIVTSLVNEQDMYKEQ